MTIEEVLQHDDEFRYMLLGRLQADCLAYINVMCPSESHLWAGNIKEHIRYMRAIWKSFPSGSKPAWCTNENITEYSKLMRAIK